MGRRGPGARSLTQLRSTAPGQRLLFLIQPVPLSRQGADAVFTKLILSQRFQQQLNEDDPVHAGLYDLNRYYSEALAD